MDVEELTEKIRTLGLSTGADLVGFASAESLEKGAPSGHKPSDLLPDAKSVIVLACDRKLNEDRDYLYEWGPHYVLKVIQLKDEIRWLRKQARGCIKEVANFLEKEGYKAIIESHGWSNIHSFKMVAYMSGLGTFGKGGFIIHPKYGPLNILACIATNATLEYGSPQDVDLCGECLECVKACKYGAIKKVGNKWIFDGRKCRVYDRIMNPITEKWTYGPCNSQCVNQCPIGK